MREQQQEQREKEEEDDVRSSTDLNSTAVGSLVQILLFPFYGISDLSLPVLKAFQTPNEEATKATVMLAGEEHQTPLKKIM